MTDKSNQELLRELVCDYYRKGYDKATEDFQIKSTELQRQNQTKRILYPICWLVGHNIDPLMRFCNRCKIAEARLA